MSRLTESFDELAKALDVEPLPKLAKIEWPGSAFKARSREITPAA
jgi:hypothetical protein